MINTNCKKCIFSSKISSNNPCEFKIIDFIKDHKTLKEVDEFYYIENYECKYCFSQEAKENNQDFLKDINIKEEIKRRNLIQYSLIVDFKNYYEYDKVAKAINKLNIRPKNVVFLLYRDSKENIGTIESILDKNIRWKAQNFYDLDIEKNDALKVALDTNKQVSNTPFLWIEHAKNLEEISINNSVERINYIVNIEQPICNFVRSKKNIENNFHNLFISYQTYNHITKNINASLEDGINSLENTTTVYYD